MAFSDFIIKAKKFLKSLNPFSAKEGKEVVNELLKKKVELYGALIRGELKEGSLVFFEYDPKDKKQICDYKPLGLVLGISRSYVLCCNFHWINMEERITLINYILYINKKGKGFRVPLEMPYKYLKNYFGRDPKFKKCIRLYIRKRISKYGVIIDPKYLLDIARLKLEHFK